MKKFSPKFLSLLGLTILVIGSFLFYLPSIKMGFISDDWNWLFDSSILLNPFSGDRWLFSLGMTFRVITWFSLAPMTMRLILLILHLIGIFLVFEIVFLITQKRIVALLAAFIFTFFYVHPAVIYSLISNEVETILGALFLSCILFFILYLKKKKKIFYWLSILSFLLSFLCKESTIILLIILFLINYLIFEKFNFKKIKLVFIRYLPYLLIALVYLLYFILSTHKGDDPQVVKGGYHFLGFNKGLISYAHVLSALVPYKFNARLYSSGLHAYIIIAASFIILSIFYLFKKIPRYIPLFWAIVLIIAAPYAFFASFGFQERYLYLASFAFSGLLAALIWELAKAFNRKIQIVLILIFCFFWIYVSLPLMLERARLGLQSSQVVQMAAKSIKSVCPPKDAEHSVIYFVNFPQALDEEGQFNVFNNGIGNMMRYICQPIPFQRAMNIIYDPQAGEFLKKYPETQEKQNDFVILAYEDGQIQDYSNKYKFFDEFIRSSISPEQIQKKTITLQETWTWNKNPGDEMNLQVINKAILIHYKLSPESWSIWTRQDLPPVPGTLGFSVDVHGDSQNETLNFQFVDKETGQYYLFKQKIDWSDWKTLRFDWSSGKPSSNDIVIQDMDDLNLVLSSDKNVIGQIQFKNFNEYY